jgi:Flp pilus assembly protein TadD
MSPTTAPDTASTDPNEALAQDLRRAEQALAAKRLGEAIGICQDILAQRTDWPPALALLARLLLERGQFARGLALVEKATALAPRSARYQNLLCSFYRMSYRFDEAVAAGRKAVTLDPNNPRVLVNLGKSLMDRRDSEAALSTLLRVLIHEPENAEAHLAIGQILLARGEMHPGWLEYEWRNKLDMAQGRIPKMKAPVWNGMRLPGRRLLIIGDQGFGDTIQFSRYIPLAAERCGEVAFACVTDLIQIMRGIPGIARIESRWNKLPPHNCHVLLSSLPMLFGTEVETIPAPIPYLTANPEDVASWKERFDRLLPTGLRRVGLVWAGRATHPNDRRRSMRLADLAALAAVNRVAFVSLQKPVPARDRLDVFPGIVDVAAELTDFAQTAAALMNLDLVITVDSAVGHLAGAMGRPAWMLLANPNDWRWMHEREDSPWYPSLRLFRQAVPGNWADVVDRVKVALSDKYYKPDRRGRRR